MFREDHLRQERDSVVGEDWRNMSRVTGELHSVLTSIYNILILVQKGNWEENWTKPEKIYIWAVKFSLLICWKITSSKWNSTSLLLAVGRSKWVKDTIITIFVVILEQVNLVDYTDATQLEELDSFYTIDPELVHYKYYDEQCLQYFVTLNKNI